MADDPLAALELEMADAAAGAFARYRVAAGWLRSADAELDALDRPVWGGVVDSWHAAVDAVADSAEAVDAFRAFGYYTV